MGAVMRMGATEVKNNIRPGAFMKMGAEERKIELVEESTIEIQIPDPSKSQELETLQKQYEEKFEGKPVPNNKKNDAEWILLKLNS